MSFEAKHLLVIFTSPGSSRDTEHRQAFELALPALPSSYSHVIFRIAPNTSARFRLEFDR
jgi:hypothetical protein